MAERPAMITERPLPEVTPLTEPFWSAARSHRLVLQRCKACNAYRFPPEVGCYACGSPEAVWSEVSGRATLYSWTVAHPPILPYFQERVPWPVVAVELEEGPRMVTNLIDVPVEEYEIGMPLQVAFEEIDEELSLVVFRSRREAS
ncbi:MAG: OB-fold domain-containing protein [Chloroflexi bacterium]|nr:OB-fold domain-containing protein [Chloroflexota bacterium]